VFKAKVQKRVFFIQNQAGWLFIISTPIMLNSHEKFDTKLVAQSLRGFLSFLHKVFGSLISQG